MRAIQFSSYGGPEVLHLSEAPEPSAGSGQVRIRVRATAVNPFDYKRRSGMMARGADRPDEPVIPGLEAAGVVDQVGDGVTDVAVGDEVFGQGNQTYAEYAVLRTWAHKPERLSFAEAAGLAVAGETAGRVLEALDLAPGAVVLVHGAAGGVGQAVVQLAREAGLRVIGTASERNRDLLRELGAGAVTYGDGLPERVAALAPEGVAGVVDTAGTQLDDLIAIAGSPDKVVTIANYSAAEHGVQFSGGGGDAAGRLARVAELVEAGRYTVRLAATFDLAEAAAAHELSQSRRADGKIALIVG